MTHIQGTNIIVQVVDLLQRRAGSLRSQFTQSVADDMNKATQALINFCGGNFNNQRLIVNAQVMDGINAVLQIKTSNDPQPIQVSVLSISAI